MRRLAAPLLVATLLALPLAPAQAQSKKELVTKILALQKPQFEQVGQAMAQAAVGQLVQGAAVALQQRVPAEKREATGKAMEAELQAYLKEVVPALRASAVKQANEAYGSKLEASFSDAELKQLIAFMESPLVKRYNQLFPETQGQVAQKVAAENKALMETKVKGLAQKLGELLEVKPAPAPNGASK